MAVCAKCAEENPDRAKFCLNCGAPLAASVPKREIRKTVTVVFSDVAGSTPLGERLDPETLRAVMARYFDAMRAVIERHGGTVEKFIGDAVMAVFGIPVLHEDDALRGVRAAAEMRAALDHFNRTLETERGLSISARTGVNTGEVVTGNGSGGHTLVTGDAVNTAARLEQAAASGEILLGEPTYQLVRDAVVAERIEPVAAKGKADAVPAYRLISVPGEAGHRRRLDAPLVGREREVALLRQAHERATVDRAPQLFTLLGSAGVGKSRLVAEFTAAVAGPTTVVRGRCLPYGEGITYWPIAEVVREAAAITETDTADTAREKVDGLLAGTHESDRVASLVGQAIGLSAEPAPQEEIFWAVRRLFELLARRRPLVVVFEDVHWAEPTLLDLVEHLADWSRDAPLLILAVARPELLDARPTWAGGKLNATTVLLEPLPAEDAARLIDQLPGGGALDSATRRRIAAAAEGNPLFVEEMLASLVDDGYLRESDTGWVVGRDLSTIRVPPSIQALLAARLDRLAPEERAVAERAAVVGRVFERGAVAALAPDTLQATVTVHLLALVRKELVRPGEPGLAGDDAFRFRHILIRDAAYEALPKQERADLHERFADWLVRVAGDRAGEYEEITGYHLEQAHHYREELGETGDRVADLARRAGQLLAASGQRAHQHGDMPGAANLLGRASSLLPPGPERVEALLVLSDALARTGQLEDAIARADEARTEAEATGIESLAVAARLQPVLLHLPEWSLEVGEHVSREAIDAFERLGDRRNVARAYYALGHCLGDAGRNGEACDALEQAYAVAAAEGDRVLASRAASMRAGGLLWGSMPAADILAVCREVSESGMILRRDSANIEAYAALALAHLGQFDEARTLIGRSSSMLAELADPIDRAANAQYGALAERLAGDLEAAERILRAADAELEAIHEDYYRSTIAAMLAGVLADRSNLAEARRYVTTARELAQDEDYATHILLRIADANVHRFAGNLALAEESARQAVAIAAGTDDLNTHADALVALAEVLQSASRAEEARACLGEAIALYERKESRVLAARARARLDAVPA